MTQSDRDLLSQLMEWELHRAAQDGNITQVGILLNRGVDIDRFDDIGLTALHYAAMAGRVEIVSMLLKAGANVNAHDESKIGNTPLSQCARECSYEVARLLVDAGADPNIPGWMGMNAINRATERSDVDADRIQSLLNKAVDRLQSKTNQK